MSLPELFLIGLLITLVLYSVVILFVTRALFCQISSPFKSIGYQVSESQCKDVLSVSVVIPVRNESVNILACLEGIKNQDYPHELMEIIVTDDFSEDYTVDIAKRFARANPTLQVMVLQANESMIKEPGKKSAISRAVGIAKGGLILATDADTSRGPHWVSFVVAKYCKSDLKMVLAPVAFQNERTVFQKIQSLEFMGLMGTTIGSAAAGFPVMCNGANIAYSRNAYLDAGGFTGNMQFSSGDDQFLMSSIGKKFGRRAIGALVAIESFVYTDPFPSWSSFLNQRLRWVSKSRGYKDAAVIILALLTYTVHFLLLAGIVYGIFHPGILCTSLALFLVKMVVDYSIVWLMARLLSKKKLLGYYFIAQVFQLFYVPIIGFLGNIIPYNWKGRRGS